MLNESIIKQHLKVLGLSGNVTRKEINARYRFIIDELSEDLESDNLQDIKNSYKFLKSCYAPYTSVVNKIPVYVVDITLSQIYSNSNMNINGILIPIDINALKGIITANSYIIKCNIIGDKGYRYSQLDLLYTLDITIIESLIGTTKEITLLDGTLLDVVVPPMSLKDDIITFKHLGFARSGNLYIQLNVVIPPIDNQQLIFIQDFFLKNIQ